jgi:hypothetical protein
MLDGNEFVHEMMRAFSFVDGAERWQWLKPRDLGKDRFSRRRSAVIDEALIRSIDYNFAQLDCGVFGVRRHRCFVGLV